MHKTKTSTTLGDVQIQPPEKLSKFHQLVVIIINDTKN